MDKHTVIKWLLRDSLIQRLVKCYGIQDSIVPAQHNVMRWTFEITLRMLEFFFMKFTNMTLNLLHLSQYSSSVTCIKCLFISWKQSIHSQLSLRGIGVRLSHLSKKWICTYCTCTCVFLFVVLFFQQFFSVVRQGLLLL